MKNNFLMGIILIFIVISLTSCTTPGTSNPAMPPYHDSSSDDLTQPAPDSYTSFEAFEEAEKQSGEKALPHYFVPATLSDDYQLTQITKRDNVYVMIEYKIASGAVSSEKLSEYDTERLSTLICRYSLYTDAQKALEMNYINKGYEPVEYQGKTYYRWDEHVQNDPEKQILGYEIAFITDGCLIFMHLPAVDTFENMLQYAQLQKVIIE